MASRSSRQVGPTTVCASCAISCGDYSFVLPPWSPRSLEGEPRGMNVRYIMLTNWRRTFHLLGGWVNDIFY